MPADLLARYAKQTPGGNGVWKTIRGTHRLEEADIFVVLEGYTGNLPDERTLFIKREPKLIRDFTPEYSHALTWEMMNCGVTWWVNKSYDELVALPYPAKAKKISCVVSSKHANRNEYINKLFAQAADIDLYGRGHDPSVYGNSYKGPLEYDGKCKWEGLVHYEYSIALENSQQTNYFTEKLADALLAWTKPIYWGCPNLDEFLPKSSYSMIRMDARDPLQEIQSIFSEGIDIEALAEARLSILHEYNIWEVVRTGLEKEFNAVL